MRLSSFVVVIPARFASSRFPGKLLQDLGGTSVLGRTYARVSDAVGAERVLIASDHPLLEAEAKRLGARHVRTSSDCLTGTDRVAAAAADLDCDWIVNAQGDEPFIDRVAIEALLSACEDAGREVQVINCMAPILDEATFRDPTAPKVVADQRGDLLYMSRACIPTTKTLAFDFAYRQVGLYAFRPAALEAFAAAGSKARLEALEDIEVLRFLELGFRVKMIEVPEPGLAIDVPADLEAARLLIADPGRRR